MRNEAHTINDDWFYISGDYLFLNIRAVPGASKTAMGEVKEGRLKVRIAAAPEDGKANEELRSYLAKLLGCAKRDIAIESGEKSRNKTLRLPAAAEKALLRNQGL
jgi:uncharacterized protein (TIGR00251 family)